MEKLSDIRVVTILPQYCRRAAAVLPRYCRSTAAVLPRYCRRTAAVLPRYCRDTAVGILMYDPMLIWYTLLYTFVNICSYVSLLIYLIYPLARAFS